MSIGNKALFVSIALVLAGCTTAPKFEQRDGGPLKPVDVSHIPDATPMPVVRTIAGNKSPYTVLGRTYVLLPDSQGYQQRGEASWYGTKFHGRRTANGEIYDMFAMTAAHKTLPIPSYVQVTNIANGASVVVRVNDRGPFHGDRIIDLSYTAAKKLGFAEMGFAQVDVKDVTPKPGTIAAKPPAAAPAAPVAPVVAQSAIGTVSSITTAPPQGYLQVGAFRALKSALTLKNQLTEMLDQSADIYLADDGWYRVRLGPFNSEQTLASARYQIEQEGFKTLVVYE